MRTTILILALMLFTIKIVAAQGQSSITITNSSWTPSVGTNPVSITGNDYINSTLTSSVYQSLLNVNSNEGYTISINKTDIDWIAGLSLWVGRTGDGTASSATISANVPFIQLTYLDQALFTGNKDRINIPLQFEIRGLSVLLPAKQYTTTIVFTISN
jgi:hypothetical protein